MAPMEAKRSETVLVVDDEEDILLLCRVNLEFEGYTVVTASSGAAGLERAREVHPDLVLLDVMMPTMDGFDVARRMQQNPETSTIPVVFMTALAASEDRRRGFEAGGVGYVVKPFDPVRLGDTVRHTLDRVRAGDREALRQELLESR